MTCRRILFIPYLALSEYHLMISILVAKSPLIKSWKILSKKDHGYLEKWNSKGASCRRFLFFLHHFVSMGRMVTRVGALESPDLGRHFKYFEHVPQTSRKFFRAIWSQVLQFLWTLRENASKFGIPKIRKKFILEAENFFL